MAKESTAGWGRPLGIACAAALATGVMTVLGQYFYEYYLARQPELIYSVEKGPILEDQGSYVQMYAIDIRNTGEQAVQDVFSRLKATTGRIGKVGHAASPGVQVTNNAADPSTLIFRAQELNEGEWVNVQAIVTLDEVKEPAIDVRGRGVTAFLTTKSSTEAEPFISAMIATLSAMTFVTIAVWTMRKSTISRVGYFTKMEIPEISTYILENSYLPELSLKVRSMDNLSYRSLCDSILASGRVAEEGQKNRHIAALKAMLVVKDINTETERFIVRAIKELEGTSFDAHIIDEIRRSSASLTEPLMLRDVIDRVIRYQMTGVVD